MNLAGAAPPGLGLISLTYPGLPPWAKCNFALTGLSALVIAKKTPAACHEGDERSSLGHLSSLRFCPDGLELGGDGQKNSWRLSWRVTSDRKILRIGRVLVRRVLTQDDKLITSYQFERLRGAQDFAWRLGPSPLLTIKCCFNLL